MAAFAGGGEGGGGGAAQPIEAWYFETPVGTRVYLTAVFLTTLACQLDLVSPFHLYFNWDLIWKGGQYWRLVTSFLYFGNFSVDFLFHMFFLVRYSRALEEGSFRGRTADFVWMLLLAASAIIIITPFLPASAPLPFLSSPLTFHLVYLWSRRNPHVRMNFLGLFTFSAPYLPYVLVGFSLLLNNVWPTGDLMGIAVGHVYYYLEDVWPRVRGGPAPRGEGGRTLAAPAAFRKLLEVLGVRDPERNDLYLPMGDGEGGEGAQAGAEGEGEAEAAGVPDAGAEEIRTDGEAAFDGPAGAAAVQEGQAGAEGGFDANQARLRTGYTLGGAD
ncbi:Der1-like family-domain-containing protein [Hyaloraphidium curvatum]|nr:Der1-like family-domain-containing protein [Hyaloraphidium curvatum]